MLLYLMVGDFFFFFFVDKAYEGEGSIGSNSEEAKSRLRQGDYLFHFCIMTCFLFICWVYIRSVYDSMLFRNFRLLPLFVLELCSVSYPFLCFTFLQDSEMLLIICFKLSIMKIVKQY